MLTPEIVVVAAARVLERDGYAGLTMRAIAQELKVQAPALYWYVQSKEQLEVMLYDHLLSDLTYAFGGADWREDLRTVARQLRRHLVSKRDICELFPEAYSLGPHSARQLDDVLGVLRSAGLTSQDAAYGFNMLFNYVVQWAAGEARWRRRREGEGQAPADGDDAAGTLRAFDAAAFPNLAALAEPLLMEDSEGRFEFGLDCLIAGLEVRRRP